MVPFCRTPLLVAWRGAGRCKHNCTCHAGGQHTHLPCASRPVWQLNHLGHVAAVEGNIQATALCAVLLERVGHQPAAVCPVWLESGLAMPLDVVVVDVGLAAQLWVGVPAGVAEGESEARSLDFSCMIPPRSS